MKATDPDDNGIQDMWQAKLAYIVAEIYFWERVQGNLLTEVMASVSAKE